MRTVTRIAAYVPAGSAGGVRVAASDEDAFTLGATAAERAWVDRDRPTDLLVVHLFGDYPAMADWGFPVLLGRGAADVFRHPGDAGELVRTVRELEAGGEGPALVVAADLSERGVDPTNSGTSPLGAAAVAFLLEGSDRSRPFVFDSEGEGRPAAAVALMAGKTHGMGMRAEGYLEDWDAAPAAGRRVALGSIRAVSERDLSAVSEGAYVPRARYIENLPSRWRLVADECSACHEVTFPARGACRRCQRTDSLTPISLPRDGGRVVAVTTIGKGGQPTEFDAQVEATGPYQVALVELTNGIRMTLQVTDAAPGELRVGDEVRTFLRRLYPMEGEWRYGRKAVPDRLGMQERRGR